MAQGKTKASEKPDISVQLAPRLKEGVFIALVALALYMSMALLSYDNADPGWTYTGSNESVNNLVGRSGAWFADVFLFFFGYLAFLFPAMLTWQAWIIFRDRESSAEFSWPVFIFKGLGLLLTILAGTALAAIQFYQF